MRSPFYPYWWARWLPLLLAVMITLGARGVVDAEKPLTGKKVVLSVSPQICLRRCPIQVKLRVQPPEHAIFAEVSAFDEGGLLVTTTKVQLWPDRSLYVLEPWRDLYEPPMMRVTANVWFDDARQTLVDQLVRWPSAADGQEP